MQGLIDALPAPDELAGMSGDELTAAYDQLQTAHDAYNALTEEQKEQITGAEVFDDLFAVLNSMTNALATVSGATYLDENGNQQTAKSATVVDSSTTTWNTGWYVVNSNVTISSRITVSGNVNLILGDRATLTASAGITVSQGNSLTIYAQSTGDSKGQLIAGVSGMIADHYAGISGPLMTVPVPARAAPSLSTAAPSPPRVATRVRALAVATA